MFTKKFTATIATTAAGALALTGCGSVEDSADTATDQSTSSAEKWQAPEGLSGEVDYYSANPQGLTDALVEAFEEKTDVHVNVFADTTGKITAKLKAEEANPQADVVYLASGLQLASRKNPALLKSTRRRERTRLFPSGRRKAGRLPAAMVRP